MAKAALYILSFLLFSEEVINFFVNYGELEKTYDPAIAQLYYDDAILTINHDVSDSTFLISAHRRSYFRPCYTDTMYAMKISKDYRAKFKIITETGFVKSENRC